MKLHRLFRERDVSGVSGVGLVAEVVEFSSGKVAVSFLPGLAGVASVTVYESLADAEAVHGHGGASRLIPVSIGEYAASVREETAA